MIDVTFTGYQPGPRLDATPWISARIQESASPDGPWSPIETIPLDPLDANPATPAIRTFTTTQASGLVAWFQVVFLDAQGDEQPTEPVAIRVTDPRDVAVLTPRFLRYIAGPVEAEQAPVTSQQALGAIADAAAEIILMTRGTFGLTLEVAGVDEHYGAANQWNFSAVPTETQQVVVCAQAAISYLYRELATALTSEEISDEGQTWRYQRSSTLQKDWLTYLKTLRDAGIDSLRDSGVVVDQYTSFVSVRDSAASASVEAWISTS